MLAGCGLYCVLSSEQWEGGGPGSRGFRPEATAQAPCHPPARFFSGTALGGDGPLCTCSRRKKTHCSGVNSISAPPERYGHVLILRACGCDLI